MTGGPSVHLSWAELACKDGSPYPSEWRTGRALELGLTFEAIRKGAGQHPLQVLSGYRSPAHNRKVGGAKNSQHLLGRALDLRHPTLDPETFHILIRKLHKAGKLPLLGGLGLYPSFVHIDVRPERRTPQQLAIWFGTRALADRHT